MTATSIMFKYINRDETTHLFIFQNIILVEEIRELMKADVEHEISK